MKPEVHWASLGVRPEGSTAITTAGGSTVQASPYDTVYIEAASGSSSRDAKEHAAALAAERLLRGLCGGRPTASGRSVESVWGNILSRSPGAMAQYECLLLTNLRLVKGRSLGPPSGTSQAQGASGPQHNDSMGGFPPAPMLQGLQNHHHHHHQQQQQQHIGSLPPPPILRLKPPKPEAWQLQVNPTTSNAHLLSDIHYQVFSCSCLQINQTASSQTP